MGLHYVGASNQTGVVIDVGALVLIGFVSLLAARMGLYAMTGLDGTGLLLLLRALQTPSTSLCATTSNALGVITGEMS